MSKNFKLAGLALTTVLLSAVANPQQADAKKFSQWASTIVNGARQIQNFRASHGGGGGGGGGGGYEPQQQQQPQSSYQGGSSGAPGSNYYNISPDTMRNPLHHQEAPQPAYNPPPTPEPNYNPSYSSSRSAYHTGSPTDNPSYRTPNYMQAHAKIQHARVAPHHVEHERAPEKTAAVAVKKPAAEDSLKLETLKPATTFDTSWVTHAVDRIETRLRAPQG